MKITLSIKKEEIEALEHYGKYNIELGVLLYKIQEQLKYSKEQNVYKKKVKEFMGDVVDKIEKENKPGSYMFEIDLNTLIESQIEKGMRTE